MFTITLPHTASPSTMHLVRLAAAEAGFEIDEMRRHSADYARDALVTSPASEGKRALQLMDLVAEILDGIKPCPFCGSEDVDPIGWLDGSGRRGPECSDCGATARSKEGWNKRAGEEAGS